MRHNPPPQTIRALPPAERTDYEKAVDAAMEGVALAITSRLRDRDDKWRFQDVQRLAKIGEALGRQKVQREGRVEDFVRNRRLGRANFFGGAGYANIGGVDPDDPLADEVAGHVNYAGGPIMAPPLGRQADDNNPLAMFRGVFDGLQQAKENELAANRRLDALKELERTRDLLKQDDLAQEEREVLEARRQSLLEEIKSHAEQAPQHPEPEEPAAPAPAAEQQIIRCLGCGNAHDEGWVDAHGDPLRCDVCNAAMVWGPRDAPAPAPDEPGMIGVCAPAPAGPFRVG